MLSYSEHLEYVCECINVVNISEPVETLVSLQLLKEGVPEDISLAAWTENPNPENILWTS